MSPEAAGRYCSFQRLNKSCYHENRKKAAHPEPVWLV